MFSVSLYFQLLIIVGMLANKSAKIAKVIERAPFFVVIQMMIARNERTPHEISNFVVFQYEFLLKIDATRTSSGIKPPTNVETSNGTLVPDLYPTYTPTNGAIIQNIQDTRFGFVLPRKISLI